MLIIDLFSNLGNNLNNNKKHKINFQERHYNT